MIRGLGDTAQEGVDGPLDDMDGEEDAAEDEDEDDDDEADCAYALVA